MPEDKIKQHPAPEIGPVGGTPLGPHVQRTAPQGGYTINDIGADVRVILHRIDDIFDRIGRIEHIIVQTDNGEHLLVRLKTQEQRIAALEKQSSTQVSQQVWQRRTVVGAVIAVLVGIFITQLSQLWLNTRPEQTPQQQATAQP